MLASLLLLIAASLCAAQDAPSPAFRLNQVGYLPEAPKVAVVVAGDLPAEIFLVKRAASGEAIFANKMSERKADPLSGDIVQWADFSDLREPGRYYIDIPEIGRSYEFVIGADAYKRAYYLAARSFYGQRCGTAVDLGEEFPGYKYAACHQRGSYHASSGKDGEAKSAYGWHDAGDYGRYVVNSGLSTGTLLWAHEMFAPRAAAISLNIPESGNGTPDLLNEIRWNLEWMLSMQDEDGGVWAKQTSLNFPGFVMPERDNTVSFVIGTGAPAFKSSCPTGDFAAVMAIAGRLYRPFDEEFAARALTAAQRGWGWLKENPSVRFTNPQGVSTGEYGDGSCSDERLWAAAELFRTTRAEQYHNYFLENWKNFRNNVRSTGPPAWPSVGAMALWTYWMAGGDDRSAETVDAIQEASISAANGVAARALESPYRLSMVESDFNWGSNSAAANYALQLLVANRMTGEQRFLDAALENLHYLLGRNAFSTSWVTQVGSNSFQKPHHRPSGADTNPEPWPGLLSGGPNKNLSNDNVLRTLPADTPPMRAWRDHQDSYAGNEIAINWNAPLVFLLAGALPQP